MKWTKTSEALLSFFMENHCIQPIYTHKKKWILHLFSLIKKAEHWLREQNRNHPGWIRMTQRSIHTNYDVPKPTTFQRSSFPTDVIDHIDRFSHHCFSYSFSLFHRTIVVHFVLEKEKEKEKEKERTKKYNDYIERIILWLYIVNAHSSQHCSKELHLFLYHTSLLKEVPSSKTEILDQHHVNTAFTYTCPRISEIVVYRKEEWFKVLIHETFHNFALDFSGMTSEMPYTNERMLRLFHVSSEVNLFEAYTETWARIWNVAFCSYFSYTHKKKEDTYFLSTFDVLMRMEIIFAFFQMVKVLRFMGLRYEDITSTASRGSASSRSAYSRSAYRENTNVLAYFIITLVLLDQYEDFLSWCSVNNRDSLLSFHKSKKAIASFCDFIESKYQKPSILEGVDCMEQYVQKNHHKWVDKNLRMTVSEWG